MGGTGKTDRKVVREVLADLMARSGMPEAGETTT